MDNRPPTEGIQSKTIWDRKTDGGFPETKELKRRVRDVIQPERNLGHVDRDYSSSSSKKPSAGAEAPATEAPACTATNESGEQGKSKTECADCDCWMTEETYKDVEGGHSGGGGSGQQSKTTTTTTGGGSGSGPGEEKKAADTNWMTEETYKDLEGGQQ